jgi:hypothetical protein
MQFWIESGRLVARPTDENGGRIADRTLLQAHELVKVDASESGTDITWWMFSANWASLFMVREWMSTLSPPYRLNFFNLGWFNEEYDNLIEAQRRLDHLITKSDIRFSARVFTQDFDPEYDRLLPELQGAMEAGEVSVEKAVVCAIDSELERTLVAHVGSNSALASVWGVSPVTYPCLTGHSYDRIVSRPYFEVIRTGRAHHDHVLAAMTQPDGDVKWLGYQRLIVPRKETVNGLPTVNILCQFGPVDISIL